MFSQPGQPALVYAPCLKPNTSYTSKSMALTLYPGNTQENTHALWGEFHFFFLDNGESVQAPSDASVGNISTRYFQKPPFLLCVPSKACLEENRL